MILTKFVCRTYPLPFCFLSPPRFFPKPQILFHFSTASAFSSATVAAAAVPSTPGKALPYGPSLHKGRKLPQFQSPIVPSSLELNSSFEEESFTRVFDIAALRVPSDLCSSLESRLRGHLLNWPRIRNVARVPGDEIEDELKGFLVNRSNSDADGDSLVNLQRRIYGKAEGDGERLSPVLYRDKLSRTFNSKGFVNFRNLAKISRPKQKKKRGDEKEREKKGVGKNEMALIEVVETEVTGDEDMSGLLGDEFRGGKWRGSTRLLLLDEHCANNGFDEMPEAIKAVFREHSETSERPALEIVKCKLTLFYPYWQMDEVLEAILPEGMIVPSSFETVGHIAHLNLRDEHLPYKKLIAKVVLDKNKARIQTVVNKIDAIHSDYRTMQLEILAGNHSLVTRVIENGVHFHVDLATVYWNSRLATERQRLLSSFTHDDVVCDVFAGVGPLAISAAKKVKYVYANDLNPQAVEYMERNCVLNKLERKIEVYNMDGRRFIGTIFSSKKTRTITQVVMNLPNDAVDFLDVFRGLFRENHKYKDSTLPRIHVYGFSKAQDPEFDFHERIRIALSEVAFEVEMRSVRAVAPGKWMLCASFVLPERVAFGRAV
ncbi:PREDICTED: tRNA (guanine(37)-N1)-methyltransferase 1 isoform X1 [Ipomoea nil]|uniref:tRNA (guanine(37)-N1)-methyltransferase 1 isoform X1 n=1 Tax=Ipomoea nil TaxID=35883 RepID=UPI000901940D|nr:PREDICTED: tRNA (guanine(37)-N1)-methyltransferase 1 isoform X1 [Ipomoea nil]